MDQIERIAHSFTGLCLRNLHLQTAARNLAICKSQPTDEVLPAPTEEPGQLIPGILRTLPVVSVEALKDRFHDPAILGFRLRKFFGPSAGKCYWFATTVYVRQNVHPSRSETLAPIYEAYILVRVVSSKTKPEKIAVEVTNPAYASNYLYVSEDGDNRESFSNDVVYAIVEQELYPRLRDVQRRLPKRGQRRQIPDIAVGCDITADLSGRAYMVTLPPF